MGVPPAADWKKTACNICSLNCGLDVQTEGGHITKARGDKDHPTSQGYVCEKSQRMDYHQNGADRITSPKRRRPDGSYEDIDWPTAIREIAEKFAAVRSRHGGSSILYYGGGSQGNHLGGTYANSTIKVLGVLYRSNALAQEKTGEAWVQGKMMGAGVHGDFEHAEVAVFLGKNPFQSHGFARTRVILRELQKDPYRSIIVIDPRRSETADMADYHLAARPGTDAWCLTALAAILVQEGFVAREWLDAHTTGFARVAEVLQRIPVAEYAKTCGVDARLLRQVAERIARAKSVSMIEDLGVQMNLHSTLNSYLNRLVWLLTGHYARPGTNNAFVPILNLSLSTHEAAAKDGKVAGAGSKPGPGSHSPVTGAKVIMGLIPCSLIPEEILTDHPQRFHAMCIESSNPVHSLADSQRMRQADYVLPATSQFEKAEATFFNVEFPRNGFHLRQPVFAPRPGTLTEAEIHARLGRTAFGLTFAWKAARDKKVARYAPVVLYRTLGETLPAGFAPAASLWGISQLFVRNQRAAAARAGFGGTLLNAGTKLFDAIITQPSGVIYSVSVYVDSWRAVRLPGNRINLCIEEMLAELATLDSKLPPHDADYPFILSAGERRSDTSNTSIRDASWHTRRTFGTLRMHPNDAAKVGCKEGDWVSMTTRRGRAQAPIELGDDQQPGHASLPNGHGLDYTAADGTGVHKGVSLNELTDTAGRDPFAGTPWHKYVPIRIDRLPVDQRVGEEAAA